MTFGSLFAGIGGFDLGLERAGMTCKWQVEIDDFCNKVLAKHWPDVKRHRDVREVGKHNLEPVDLICGGFPCQPFSCAGKRKGKEDERFLWPEMFRIISELKPRWIIGENVAGFVNMGLDDCISDLEREGYEVQPFIIPACAVNAPHRRDRVWIVAYSQKCRRVELSNGDLRKCIQQGTEDRLSRKFRGSLSIGHAADTDQSTPSRQRRDGGEILQIAKPERLDLSHRDASDSPNNLRQSCGSRQDERRMANEDQQNVADSTRELLNRAGDARKRGRREYSNDHWRELWIEAATRLCRVDARLPRRMDRVNRLKALGNAVVPQIVEIIGRAITEVEKL